MIFRIIVCVLCRDSNEPTFSVLMQYWFTWIERIFIAKNFCPEQWSNVHFDLIGFELVIFAIEFNDQKPPEV